MALAGILPYEEEVSCRSANLILRLLEKEAIEWDIAVSHWEKVSPALGDLFDLNKYIIKKNFPEIEIRKTLAQ